MRDLQTQQNELSGRASFTRYSQWARAKGIGPRLVPLVQSFTSFTQILQEKPNLDDFVNFLQQEENIISSFFQKPPNNNCPLNPRRTVPILESLLRSGAAGLPSCFLGQRDESSWHKVHITTLHGDRHNAFNSSLQVKNGKISFPSVLALWSKVGSSKLSIRTFQNDEEPWRGEREFGFKSFSLTWMIAVVHTTLSNGGIPGWSWGPSQEAPDFWVWGTNFPLVIHLWNYTQADLCVDPSLIFTRLTDTGSWGDC